MRVNRRMLLAGGAVLALSACNPDDSPATPTPEDTEPPGPGEEMTSGELATRGPGDRFDPTAALFSAGGSVGGVGHGDLVFWDAESGEISSTVSADLPETATVWAFSGELAAYARGTSITVINRDGDTLHSLSATSAPSQLSLSPDETHLAVSARGEGISVWSLQDETLAAVAVSDAPSEPRLAAHFLPDGRLLVYSATDQCPPQIWSADGGQQEWTASPESPYYHLKLADDTFSLIAENEQRYYLETRNAEDFTLTESFELEFRPRATAQHPDATYVAILPGGGPASQRAIHLFNTDSGETIQLAGHTHPVASVVFSEDGTLLFSINPVQGVLAFDVATGELVAEFDLPT